MKITSLKGREVDFNALRAKHASTIAINGGSGPLTNARGDVLGRGGEVIKTQAEVIKDYYENNPKAVTVSTVSLKDADEDMMTPAQAIAALEGGEVAKTVQKRRSRDSED
jgi:hypothetical protein